MIAVIVEGWSDHEALRRVYSDQQIRTIVTNGTKLNNRIKEQIQEALDEGLPTYILTDPDIAGDQLSAMLQRFFPIPRISVDPRRAKQERTTHTKYGLEYCSNEYLKELLERWVKNGKRNYHTR